MRSPIRLAVVPLAVALAASVATAVQPIESLDCQYVLVVDACQKKLLVYPVGLAAAANTIALDGDLAGSFAPGGVDFATVPEYAASYVFLTQGPFLRVLHQAELTTPRLVDLEQDLGLTGIWLFRVHAAEPVQINGVTRYPLYAVGGRSGQPWLLVFDQEALLAGELVPSEVLLASGPLCDDPLDCSGVGIDVAAGAYPAVGGVQDARVSMLKAVGGMAYQFFYSVTLHEDLTFDVFLDPANAEGVPLSASLPLSLGVDYDSFGLQAWGVFQTSGTVADLTGGGAACALPGDPTDVEVWGPGVGLDHSNYLFVTTNVPDGADLLLAYPADECPGDSAAGAELTIGAVPQALALSSDRSNTPWVYTVNRDYGISARHLLLTSDGGSGDRIEVDEALDIPLDGCPYEVTIRDPAYNDSCETFPTQSPKPPRIDCDEDPDDPRCAEKEEPVDFGEE